MRPSTWAALAPRSGVRRARPPLTADRAEAAVELEVDEERRLTERLAQRRPVQTVSGPRGADRSGSPGSTSPRPDAHLQLGHGAASRGRVLALRGGLVEPGRGRPERGQLARQLVVVVLRRRRGPARHPATGRGGAAPPTRRRRRPRCAAPARRARRRGPRPRRAAPSSPSAPGGRPRRPDRPRRHGPRRHGGRRRGGGPPRRATLVIARAAAPGCAGILTTSRQAVARSPSPRSRAVSAAVSRASSSSATSPASRSASAQRRARSTVRRSRRPRRTRARTTTCSAWAANPGRPWRCSARRACSAVAIAACGSSSASSAVASSTRASAASAAAPPSSRASTAHVAARRASRCRFARSSARARATRFSPIGAPSAMKRASASSNRASAAGRSPATVRTKPRLWMSSASRHRRVGRPGQTDGLVEVGHRGVDPPGEGQGDGAVVQHGQPVLVGQRAGQGRAVAGQRLVQAAQPLEQGAVLGRGQERGVARSPRPRPVRSPRARPGPGRPGTAPGTA